MWASLGVDSGAVGEAEGLRVGDEGEEAKAEVEGCAGVEETAEDEADEEEGGEGEGGGGEGALVTSSLSSSRDSRGGEVSSMGESFFMRDSLVGITTSVLYSTAAVVLPIELELASLSDEEALKSKFRS